MTTRITRNRSTKDRGSQNNEISTDNDDDDVMMEEDDDVATTQGVKADAQGHFAVRPPCELDAEGSVAGNSLILPVSLQQDDSGEEIPMEDDDISTLTEYSMEEEDDNVSQTTQNTAWTVITTGTDSTTVPTRNFPPNGNGSGGGDKRERLGEKRPGRKEHRLFNNSQFKRRRLG